MNEKTKALLDYTEVMNNPVSIGTFEGVSKFMGAMNELLYGINTHKEVQNPEEEDLGNNANGARVESDAEEEII